MVKQDESLLEPSVWLSALREARGAEETVLVERALKVLQECGHPSLAVAAISIADIQLQLEMDSETIAAALLYPVVKYVKQHHTHDPSAESLHESLRAFKSEEHLAEHYSVAISKLLHDCMQMQSLGQLQKVGKYNQHQVENLRKMLLAMVTDIRAVLIILSERLVLLRHAKSLPPAEQQTLARETLDVYAPLANRIGIWQLKWEIEDLCLRYLEPETYTTIAKFLANKRVERVRYVNHAIDTFSALLKQHQLLNFEINGRVKHIYSIYKKMTRKAVPLDQIYDISAVRVLVKDIPSCYAVLSALQSEFKHIPQEFDDYIAQPKPNGYQSIHTVLYGPENHVVEVQIRTHEMHETSELGAASHWRYKEGVSQQAAYEAKIALLRQIMGWQREVAAQTEGSAAQPVQDIFADRVYAFTPQGDIVDLPQGSTPLDFAYHVHSEVGHRCRGAKADGKMVPLTYQLQTGNRVEILTSKAPNPSRDWLNPHLGYIKSGRARSVLAHWFRGQDALAEKELKKTKVMPAAPAKKTHELPLEPHTIPLKAIGKISGIDSMLTKFALCCKPLPGDAIIGYITQNRGVSIHRRNCSNIANLLRNDVNRFMEINWGKGAADRYPVDLILTAHERPHLLRDITGALSNEEFHVVGLRTQLKSGAEISVILTIMIAGLEELNQAIKLLQQVNQVHDIRRI